jgi:hypothetical protein
MNLSATRKYWYASFLMLCLTIGGVRAEELHAPTQTETLGMLAANQFSELDSRFGAVQAAYKAWACNRRQKCRIGIFEARIILIYLVPSFRQIRSYLHSKTFAKSTLKI